jgi:hypothetical protein
MSEYWKVGRTKEKDKGLFYPIVYERAHAISSTDRHIISFIIALELGWRAGDWIRLEPRTVHESPMVELHSSRSKQSLSRILQTARYIVLTEELMHVQ